MNWKIHVHCQRGSSRAMRSPAWNFSRMDFYVHRGFVGGGGRLGIFKTASFAKD
jgi:hypothetical protein